MKAVSFANIEEVIMALEAKQVETLSPIRLRYTGPVLDMTTAYDDQDILHTDPVEFNKQYINTTVGRAILNDALPEGIPFINGLLKKKGIGQLVNFCYLNLGLEVTVKALDRIKELGFQYATRSGLSVGLDDMVIPESSIPWCAMPRSRWSRCSSNTWTAQLPTSSARTRYAAVVRRHRSCGR